MADVGLGLVDLCPSCRANNHAHTSLGACPRCACPVRVFSGSNGSRPACPCDFPEHGHALDCPLRGPGELDLAPIVEQHAKTTAGWLRTATPFADNPDAPSTVLGPMTSGMASAIRLTVGAVPTLVDEVRKLRAIVERVTEAVDHKHWDTGTPEKDILRAAEIRAALVDQCHHIDGEAECWHFGGRDGRDG